MGDLFLIYSILPEVLGICEFVLDNLPEILDYIPSLLQSLKTLLPEFLESTMPEFLDSLNTLVSDLLGYLQALLDFVDESIPEPLGNPSCSGEAIETEACEVPTCSGFPQPPANCSECAQCAACASCAGCTHCIGREHEPECVSCSHCSPCAPCSPCAHCLAEHHQQPAGESPVDMLGQMPINMASGQVPVDMSGSWLPWSSWSICIPMCGGLQAGRSRARACPSNSSCVGDTVSQEQFQPMM